MPVQGCTLPTFFTYCPELLLCQCLHQYVLLCPDCHSITVGHEVRSLRPSVLQNLTSAHLDAGFLCIEVLFVCLADIRMQLTEQLRCLDVRMESQVAVVSELQDYFRRRAEVELDYSKNLDKLAKSLQLRHKEQKQK